jgi:AAA+ superfamily predicted ATPase
MVKTTKLNVLKAIGKIYEMSKRCKLENSFFSKMDRELLLLSSYFGTSKSQSLFIAIVFYENYNGDSAHFKDILRHLECSPIKILEYNDDFNYLCKSGIFIKEKSRFKMKFSCANDQFIINERIAEAILNNETMPNLKEEKLIDVIEVLEKIYIMGEQCYDSNISTDELFNQVRELISNYMHFPLIRNINSFKFGIEDTYLYLFLIWKTLSGKELTDIGRALDFIFDSESKRINYLRSLNSGENILVKYNFIELVEAILSNNSGMKLSDNSINLLKECGINLITSKKKNENIISPTDIPHKELIFSESEMQQLFMLKGLLNDTKYKETQDRLTIKNLPKGVTVLLHGAAGTGKTEIAKQLAKETNRELMKVEISQSKSMWFGESEKIVKQIFTDYKKFSKECKRTPILLFNEADAIISKRKAIGSSNLAQTENAIQNIILEELENFDGILFATTNLVDNLDSAFERRFLFKIQFQKPDVSIRARIWKSKMPLLEMEGCKVLAEKFNFSGGQIDNVLRKNEIHEIVNGVQASLENLLAFCKEETLSTQRRKVGFSKV